MVSAFCDEKQFGDDWFFKGAGGRGDDSAACRLCYGTCWHTEQMAINCLNKLRRMFINKLFVWSRGSQKWLVTGHCTLIPHAFEFMRFLRFNRLQFSGCDEWIKWPCINRINRINRQAVLRRSSLSWQLASLFLVPETLLVLLITY
jgi:hypothetical protein